MRSEAKALDYPFGVPDVGASPREIRPGVWWLTFRLPFQLDHVNVWLLDDGAGFVLVDTGLGIAETQQRWRALLGEPQLAGRPIRRVLVTHMHPDHIGQAGWLVRRCRAPLLMTRTEWLTGRLLVADAGRDQLAAYARFYRACGLDAPTVAALARRGRVYKASVVRIPPVFTAIADGDVISIGGRAWQVIIGRGHVAEQACLHCPELDLLIAADQVLPRISPNVAVWPFEPEADPLAEFLASLERFGQLPADTLMLPSHGPVFLGLRERVAQLSSHHDERLEVVRRACRNGATVLDVSRALFARELDLHQTLFAVGEALAHLHRLVAAGELRRTARADGVGWFEVA